MSVYSPRYLSVGFVGSKLGEAPVSQRKIAAILADGSVLSSRQIGELTGLSRFALWEALRRCWVKGLVLRSASPFYEVERLNKGRAGRSRNVRPFHLYALKPVGVDHLDYKGTRLVTCSESVKEARGGSGGSKAKKILQFLKSHKDETFFSKDTPPGVPNVEEE